MRVNDQSSSSCSQFYKEILPLCAASVPSIPCFPLDPLYAQTCSNKLPCVQEGFLCPWETFFLWLAVCLLCPSDPLCNQSVCLQTAHHLCLLLLVHEFHLVTAYILLNNFWYQLPPILPIAHTWKEEYIFRLVRLKFLYVTCGFSPFSLYLKKFSVPSLLPPQAGTLFLPVCNFPMLFFFMFGNNRLCPLHLAVAGDQVTLSWN